MFLVVTGAVLDALAHVPIQHAQNRLGVNPCRLQQHAPHHPDAAAAHMPAFASTRTPEEQPSGTDDAVAPTSAPVPAVASKSMDLWDADHEPAPRPGRPTRSLNVQQEPIGAYFDGGEGFCDDKPCAKHEPEGAPPTMTGRYKRLHAMYERVYGCRAPLADLS